MSKLRYILLMLVASVVMTSHAGGEDRLTFVNADGTSVSFSTSGLVITYNTDDEVPHAIVVNDETSASLDLSKLESMYFGEKDSYLRGDVNSDNEVNIADINAIIAIILGGDAHDETRERADVNLDGEVNIADVNSIIDIILSN